MAFSVSWKLQEHKDLTKVGFEHSVFLDVLSKNYRKRMFEIWNQTPLFAAKAVGCKFSLRTPPISLREVFMEEIYNVEGFKPSKGDIVVDVGANYGDSAIWWSKVMGARVIAFEPLEQVFEILKENVELNQADVELFHMALGDGSDLSGFSDGNMFISGKADGTLKYKSERLDGLGLTKLDLLKIDVEGFEYSVLSGAQETLVKFKPAIIIETHSSDLRGNCHKLLSQIGYKLRVEGRKLYPNIPGMDEVQNLFYSAK